MKKVLAALAAAAMLCCTLVSPVSAEETYRKGDVNMDGVVDVEDAQLALMEYGLLALAWQPQGVLSEEQRELARVVSPEILEANGYDGDSEFILHAQFIMNYYAVSLIDKSVQETDICTWLAQIL